MDNFFDKQGRDRIIHDWIKNNKPEFLPVFEYVLSRLDDYKNFNILFLIAFEAGYEFAKAAKQDRLVKIDYEYEVPYN